MNKLSLNQADQIVKNKPSCNCLLCQWNNKFAKCLCFIIICLYVQMYLLRQIYNVPVFQTWESVFMMRLFLLIYYNC